MQEKNIKKMTEMADTTVNDLPTLNILLCYLLYKIERPVNTEQLYEIAIGTGVINYFYYQDSIDYLTKNGLISVQKDELEGDCYVLESMGKECAKQLKSYAPKTLRDKLVLAALRYFTRVKYEQEIKIEYEPAGKGYYMHVRCLDVDCDLMDLKIYAPDMTQAKLLGERIMLNPAGFYGKVIDLALSNEEPPYDLSDN
ncbi:MAG: DUF4364 family protein [Ruminococcus sp.]|nr:DUF4364 family protein [Ruminococcus sp.]